MAASRGTSNGPDSLDLIMTILAFEHINKVRVSVRFGRVDVGDQSALAFQAEAWKHPDESSVAPPLACVKMIWGSRGRQSMEAVILQLLYKLDAEMAVSEFEREGTKEA